MLDTLFERAIRQALDHEDVNTALQRIGSPDERASLRTQLENAIRSNRESVLGAVRLELEQFERLNEVFASAERQEVRNEAASTPTLAAELLALREEIDSANQEMRRLTGIEADIRRRIEDLRDRKQRAGSEAPSGADASERRGVRALLRGDRRRVETPEERLDREYVEAVSSLQEVKKQIGDVAVSQHRLTSETGRLERPLREKVNATRTDRTVFAVAHDQLTTAERDLERALVQKGMLPLARTWLQDNVSEVLAKRYARELHGTYRGLSELFDPEFEIETQAKTRLSRLLNQLPGGSVGVSGPRGAGKTTLIESFRSGRSTIKERGPALGVMVSAPVRYEAGDFLLHLFAKTCREVLPTDLAHQTEPPPPDVHARVTRYIEMASVRGVVLGSALILLLGLLLIGLDLSERNSSLEVSLVAGGLLVVAALIALANLRAAVERRRRRRAYLGDPPSEENEAVIKPRRVLTRILVLLPVRAAQWLIGLVLLWAALGLLAEDPTELSASFWMCTGTLLLAAIWLRPMRDEIDEYSDQTDRTSPPFRDQFSGGTDGPVATSVSFAARNALGVAAVVSVPLLALEVLDEPADAQLAGGIILAAVGATLVGSTRLLPRVVRSQLSQKAALEERGGHANLTPLQRDAKRELAELEFDLSVSSEWSAGGTVSAPGPLKLPFGLQGGLTGGRQLTRRARSLPEVVDAFRRFVGPIRSQGPVVIAIDELDKLTSEGDAERFLNEIKAVFDIPDCYFLISVSEEAVASFERRGLPFRDVFDSSFDEIFRVRELNLAVAEALLAKRVLEMPLPFVALCHCISGGLARDLIRVARTLYETRDEHRETHISPLAKHLVQAELLQKRDATIVAVRALGHVAGISEALRWLGALGADDLTLTALEVQVRGAEEGCARISLIEKEQDERATKLLRLLREFVGYWYFCVTLTDFFGSSRSGKDFENAEMASVPTLSIEQMALARQAFAVDSQLAWERITTFREAMKCPVLDFPQALALGSAGNPSTPQTSSHGGDGTPSTTPTAPEPSPL